MQNVSGNTINETIDNEFVGHQHTSGENFKENFEDVQQQQKMPNIDFSFLKTPTGEGEIDDYLNHPLNPKRSRALGQILRGMTGFFGTMSYALVDIVIGVLNLKSERTVINNGTSGGVDRIS